MRLHNFIKMKRGEVWEKCLLKRKKTERHQKFVKKK